MSRPRDEGENVEDVISCGCRRPSAGPPAAACGGSPRRRGSQCFRIAATWRAIARHRRICRASSAAPAPHVVAAVPLEPPARILRLESSRCRRHTASDCDALTPK